MSTPIIPFAPWLAGTNQNSIPANDNALRAEILQRNVNNATTAQPASPSDGDTYIIQSTHTGVQWSTFTPKDLAIYKSGTWYAYAPVEGARVSVSGVTFVYFSGAWSAVSASFTGGTLSSALNEAPPVTIASSSTPAIGAAAGNTINLTGTTTVTGFDTIAEGAFRRVIFAGVLTLTHNATSLILPTGANITTAAGDVAEFLSLGSGNWRCTSYTRANGNALVGAIDRNTVTAVTPASGVATFDCSLGDYFTLAPTANVTSLVFSNIPASPKGTTLMVRFTQDTTPRTVAWPAAFKWAGGSAGAVSTGSGAIDVLALTTFNQGTSWHATLAKAFA